MRFRIHYNNSRWLSGNREVISQIEHSMGFPTIFPLPSFSAMSPFMRFICMTHGLSVASPVRKSLLLDSSVAEMSAFSIDESRDDVRRSNTYALALMVSSRTVIENSKGIHLPQGFPEFMKRYRNRLIPYLQRIRKNTIFDFED